jgi:hypothetical protein
MEREPFPDRRPDDQEPEGSGSRPVGEYGPDGENHGPPEGAEQGLFVCLPAEELTLAGFAQDGRADTMAPGPLLATVLDAITGEDGAGLAALSEDQLVGVVSAARRLESRAAWAQLAAMREFAARRPDTAGGQRADGTRFSTFAADELAAEFNLSWYSAAEQIAYSCEVAERLPKTFAALAKGKIHPVHLRIIEDVTRVLSAADAAEADEVLAKAAPSKTFGQLRSAAHRLILKLDPDSARRRKEAARKEAHVRRFREASGNAGMIARELPSDEVLASWQHVEQRALDLRAAGVPGTLQELRVRAYLDLLQERDSRIVADPGVSRTTAEHGSAAGTSGPDAPDGSGQVGPHSGPEGNAPESRPEGSPGPDGPQPGPGGADGPGHGPGGSGADRPQDGPGIPEVPGALGGRGTGGHDGGPAVAALVNITVPLAALQGLPGAAGEAAGFGLLDASDTRALVAAAARHPRTRWCLTALGPDGTAAAHGCAAGRHPWSMGQPTDDFLAALKLVLNTVIRGPCDHAGAERSYRPSRKLQHLVNCRNTRCTAPGCSQAAARCDLDHTQAWHRGGITCECNIAPLCRHHHKCKQSDGWKLEQPSPGILVWTTPAGRHYVTQPSVYAA